MKKNKLHLLFLLIVTLPIFPSCKDKSDLETEQTNKWIYETMDTYYLWADELPSYAKSSENPKDYYNSLLHTIDYWSYMTEDYTKLSNSLNGTEVSTGYSLSLYLRNSVGNDVIGIVNFVYKNTPADLAGIERGDVLLKINNQTITTDNYYELIYETTSQNISLGAFYPTDFGNSIEPTGEVVQVVAEEIDTNPILHYEILNEGASKIGYLVYTDFISAFSDATYDSDKIADLYLKDVFSTFKNAGITELILDLRYNRGGSNMAARYLASSLAPSTVNENTVFVNYEWNDLLDEYWKNSGKTDQLEEKFLGTSNLVKMDLSRLVILTTATTASASELTIIGLDPYMEVITVGEATHGKYVGSIVIPDDKDKWALMPIVLKYSNAIGYTDFSDGITPDVEVAESGILYPFGDDRDPILAKGIEVLTGETKRTVRSISTLNGQEMVRVANLPSSLHKKDGLLYIELDKTE